MSLVDSSRRNQDVSNPNVSVWNEKRKDFCEELQSASVRWRLILCSCGLGTSRRRRRKELLTVLSLASDNSEALPQDDAAVNTAATAVKRPWWCSLDLMVVVNASRCLCMRYVHTRSVSNRRRLMGEARFSGSWLVAHHRSWKWKGS